MNKLLIACMSAAFALSVNAADWFNAGLGSDSMEGGEWTKGTVEEGKPIALTPESGEVAFTVAEGSEKSLDTDVVTITSTVALTAYDELPEVVSGTKAALAPVDDGETVAYYGLVSGKFVKLTGATPKDEAVTVTIQMRKVLGQTQVKYNVGGTDLQDASGNTWIYTTVTDAPTEVAYSGTGTVSNLEGSTDGAEYLTAANPTISDAAGLAAVAKTAADFNGLAGQTVTLDKDIALTGTVTPIGAGNNKDNRSAATFGDTAFKGVFDGDNHTISGVILPCQDYVGLFGSTLGATIKNLKVSLGNATGFDGVTTGEGRTAEYSGAPIVGCALNTTIENCETVATEGAVFTAAKAAAGIVGYAGSGTTVKDCTNNLPIMSTTNAKAAGIVGCAQDATGDHLNGGVGLTIDGCSNTGTVTGKSGGNGSGLVTYTDNAVTFKGANSTTAGDVVSVIYLNSGSITIDEGATFTVPADKKTVNKNAVDGLQLATVSEGVATLVKAADVTTGGSYKVMAAGAAPTIELAADESVAFDTTLATITDTGITAAAGCKVTKATEDNITTYTAVEAAVGFTITIAENTSATITIGEAEAVDAATVSKIPEGADYVVTYSPADGYMFAAGTETQVSGTADEDVELEGPTALAIVATVDGTTYASMDDAIDAAIAAGKPLIPAEGQTVVAPNGFVAETDPETGAVTFVAKVAEAIADGYVYDGFLPVKAAHAVKIFDGTLETFKTKKFAAKMCGDYIEHGKPVYADAVLVYDADTLQVQYLDGNLLKVTQVKLVEKEDGVYAYAIGYGYFSNKTVADIGTVFRGSSWNTPASSSSDPNANVSVLAVATAPVAAISCSFDGEIAVSKKTVSFDTISDANNKFAGQYDTDETAAKTTNKPWSAGDAKLVARKDLWSVLLTAKMSTTENGVLWSMGRAHTDTKGLALVQKNANAVALVNWNTTAPVTLVEANVKGGSEAYHTFVIVADETAESDRYSLYIDGVLAAASGEAEVADYSITAYQFGDVHGRDFTLDGIAANSGAWLDEVETFTYPLSAAEVEAASVKHTAKVDNSVLVWNGTNDTVIGNDTTAENPLGNLAAIGGATELVFDANATVALADDLACKNITVNGVTLTLKRGSTSNVINDQTITLNGGKLFFENFNQTPLNVAGTIVLNGGTLDGTGWPGLEGTITLDVKQDTNLFANKNSPMGGSAAIIKKGDATLTFNPPVTTWNGSEFQDFASLEIKAGKVVLPKLDYTGTDLRYGPDHVLQALTGEGELVLADGASVTVMTATTTKISTVAGKVVKSETLEGGAVRYYSTTESSPILPIDPESPKAYDTAAEAAEAAEAINADKANLINAPAGVDKAKYVANFEAVVTDGNMVVVQLTSAAEADVRTAVNNAQATVLNPDENGKATIVTEPGLYYGIAAVSELDAMATAQPDTWTMATETELKLEVTKPSPAKGFYRVMSTVKPPVAE